MISPKVLIVEDEADIRELISVHVKREGYQIRAVEDGEKALKVLRDDRYDLIILDWMLPGLSGLEICKRIRATDPLIPVLMVTARADTADVVLGLEAGADDYLVKPFAIPILVARMKALLRRKVSRKSAAGAYCIGAVVLDEERHEVTSAGQVIDLTASEFRLLSTLMLNEGRVLSREKLIESVQGEGVSVTLRSVDTHVFGLRKKLGAGGEFIETVRGVGYRIRSGGRPDGGDGGNE